MTPKTIALIIFLVSYVLFIFKNDIRTQVAIVAAVLLILTGALTPIQAFHAVNWNVLGIFIGMLIVSSVFMESKVPAYMAEIVVSRVSRLALALLLICIITGFISAFLDNVSTVLIVAPFALSIAKKLKVDPTSMMIGIAVSSNLQGTATLIGDPPSMLLGGFAHMNFWDFFIYQGRPSIFFAVELGAIASFTVLYLIFRIHDRKINVRMIEKVKSWWPSVFLVMLILLLAGSSFVRTDFPYISGSLCLAFAFISLIWRSFFWGTSAMKKLSSLDWDTSLFLAAVFILVGSMSVTGWVDAFASSLSTLIGTNVFLGYTVIVFFSVFVSALIDNIPFLAAMLPVAMTMSAHLGIKPSLFLFGLLIGSCLGGNITPIGASANIVACGILKKEGHKVSFGRFFRIGFPFTMAAVIVAYLFIWFVWK